MIVQTLFGERIKLHENAEQQLVGVTGREAELFRAFNTDMKNELIALQDKLIAEIKKEFPTIAEEINAGLITTRDGLRRRSSASRADEMNDQIRKTLIGE